MDRIYPKRIPQKVNNQVAVWLFVIIFCLSGIIFFRDISKNFRNRTRFITPIELIYSLRLMKNATLNRKWGFDMDDYPKTKITAEDLVIQTLENSEERIKISFQGSIGASSGKIFPLLCPKREEEWIDDWDADAYKLISTKSGFNEKNCVFQENFTKKFLFRENGPTTWLTAVYEPEQFILEFLLIFDDMAVMNRAIRLVESKSHTTTCQWSDTITSLSGPWNESVRQRLETQLKAFSYYLGVILKYYCEAGKILKLFSIIENSEDIDLPEDIRSNIQGLFSTA